MIDETFETIENAQESEDPKYQLLQAGTEDLEKRKAGEKDIVKQWDLSAKESLSQMLPTMAFDVTNNYLCYSCPLGVKVYNLKNDTVARLHGKSE